MVVELEVPPTSTSVPARVVVVVLLHTASQADSHTAKTHPLEAHISHCSFSETGLVLVLVLVVLVVVVVVDGMHSAHSVPQLSN